MTNKNRPEGDARLERAVHMVASVHNSAKNHSKYGLKIVDRSLVCLALDRRFHFFSEKSEKTGCDRDKTRDETTRRSDLLRSKLLVFDLKYCVTILNQIKCSEV